MHPEELTKYLKENVNAKSLEIAMFKYIKSELQGVFLYWQKDQMFNKSVGSDGQPLGFYKHKRKGKDEGQPYTMVDTGQLKEKTYIKVYYRHIIIGSERVKPDAEKLRMFEHFENKNWWGLTDKNLQKIIRIYLIPFCQEWMRKQLL